MPATIQFVDSIGASPTVRLDINDAVAWFCGDFSAPPPRVRRTESENAMRDGGIVSSASYGNRTLTLELTLLNTSTEDAAATEMQKLWRELDRPTNYLRYQREGASKPVFFRLFRSDASDLEELWTTPIARNITIELLAEPFALGLKETLGPYVVTSNPASASNPGYIDLPTIIGDVSTDLVYWDNASGGSTYMSRLVVAHTGDSAVAGVTSSVQAEAMQLAIDTTNIGGGPDAGMSGTGTNNFCRTSFATTSTLNAARVQTLTPLSQPAGSYRVLVAVRRTGVTSALQVRCMVQNSSAVVVSRIGDTITLPLTTNRQLVDLGIFGWPDAASVGVSGTAGVSPARVVLQAGRTGGTDSLDWDAVFYVPAGGQLDSVVTNMLTKTAATSPGSNRLVLDGGSDQVFMTPTATDPTTTSVAHVPAGASGGFPKVTPGLSNRLYVLSYDQATPAQAVTTTTTVNLAYWPRYLFVRPVST